MSAYIVPGLGGFRITLLLRQSVNVRRTLFHILLQVRGDPRQSEDNPILWGYSVQSFLSDTNAVHGGGQEAVSGCVGFLDIFDQQVCVGCEPDD